MFRKRKLQIIIVSLLLLVISACSGADSSSSSKSTKSGSVDGVIKLGVSVPLSGAGSTVGIPAVWVAEQAAKKVNEDGGVTVDGKNYKFEVIAYDNKFDAATGAEVAKTLVNRDKVDFFVGLIGSTATIATQSITEPEKIIVLNGSWDKEQKGPKFPYSFTTFNTPAEFTGPLISHVVDQHPDMKTVAMLNPNDVAGNTVDELSKKEWEDNGVKVIFDEYYERGTTDFSSIVTKILSKKPDIVDIGATPPADGGLILKALAEQGWDGVKVNAAGSSGEQLIQAAGEGANGTYLGVSPVFEGETATEIQKDLAIRVKEEVNQTLSGVALQPWEAIMALKAAIDKAGTLDSDTIREVLPTVVVESSYGPTVFGSEDYYGAPQQLLLPITVSKIENGTTKEVVRIIPEEAKEKLKK